MIGTVYKNKSQAQLEANRRSIRSGKSYEVLEYLGEHYVLPSDQVPQPSSDSPKGELAPLLAVASLAIAGRLTSPVLVTRDEA